MIPTVDVEIGVLELSAALRAADTTTFLSSLIVVARSWEESATLEGTASQASSEGSRPWGK